MAIARMLRVSVLGYAPVVSEVTAALQRVGVMEIERREIDHGGVAEMQVDEPHLHAVEKVLAQAQFVRDFLHRYHEPDVAFGVFISEKFHLTENEYHQLEPDEAFSGLYRECERISDRLASIERERARLESRIAELEPWRELHLQIRSWQGTEHVALFTGTVPLRTAPQVREALRESVDEVSVAEVGNDGRSEAWVVMAHVSVLDDVKGVLSVTDFTEVAFPELADYPAEEIADAEERLRDMEQERVGLEERVRELTGQYPHVFALVETLHSRLEAAQVRSHYAATARTFLISGWMPERRRESLLAALEPVGSDIDISFDQPEAGQSVPVELVNNVFVRPFEVLTDLYGRPGYFGFDPTPILAPFFFLFFGMCLGDVGYGIMLMVGAWLIKTRLDVAPGVKKFMDLLIAGGLASAIWGALTRSYLALQVEQLPEVLQYTPLIDPGTEVMLLLGVSVAIGVIHVSVAVFLSAYQKWGSGAKLDAVQDDVSILIFLACLVVALLPFAGILDPAVTAPLMIAGFAELFLLKGHILDYATGTAKLSGVWMVPFKGFLGLYDMVGFGSDFLSYTRLAALGLASLYVGDAMNRLTDLSSGIPAVGFVVAALIFVVGHVFNVVINILGAFVHPTRLQYVEFFGKFYEGGGRTFAPFSPRTKQLVLHPHNAGEQKGGPRS